MQAKNYKELHTMARAWEAGGVAKIVDLSTPLGHMVLSLGRDLGLVAGQLIGKF